MEQSPYMSPEDVYLKNARNISFIPDGGWQDVGPTPTDPAAPFVFFSLGSKQAARIRLSFNSSDDSKKYETTGIVFCEGPGNKFLYLRLTGHGDELDLTSEVDASTGTIVVHCHNYQGTWNGGFQYGAADRQNLLDKGAEEMSQMPS